jgi:hypothetical protein
MTHTSAEVIAAIAVLSLAVATVATAAIYFLTKKPPTQ